MRQSSKGSMFRALPSGAHRPGPEKGALRPRAVALAGHLEVRRRQVPREDIGKPAEGGVRAPTGSRARVSRVTWEVVWEAGRRDRFFMRPPGRVSWARIRSAAPSRRDGKPPSSACQPAGLVKPALPSQEAQARPQPGRRGSTADLGAEAWPAAGSRQPRAGPPELCVGPGGARAPHGRVGELLRPL